MLMNGFYLHIHTEGLISSLVDQSVITDVFQRSVVKDLLLEAAYFLNTARLFLPKAATFPASATLHIPSF